MDYPRLLQIYSSTEYQLKLSEYKKLNRKYITYNIGGEVIGISRTTSFGRVLPELDKIHAIVTRYIETEKPDFVRVADVGCRIPNIISLVR